MWFCNEFYWFGSVLSEFLPKRFRSMPRRQSKTETETEVKDTLVYILLLGAMGDISLAAGDITEERRISWFIFKQEMSCEPIEMWYHRRVNDNQQYTCNSTHIPCLPVDPDGAKPFKASHTQYFCQIKSKIYPISAKDQPYSWLEDTTYFV